MSRGRRDCSIISSAECSRLVLVTLGGEYSVFKTLGSAHGKGYGLVCGTCACLSVGFLGLP
jgi:hypothetical protein